MKARSPASSMIVSAIVAVCLIGGLESMRRGWTHAGSGEVLVSGSNPNPWYGDAGGDRSKVVSGAEYKREKYVMGGMMLAIGAFIVGIQVHGHRRHRRSPEMPPLVA